MRTVVDRLSADELLGLISPTILSTMSDEAQEIMRRSIYNSDMIWLGTVDNKILGFWGLVVPTLLSQQAYLWLYSIPDLENHVFLFVRHSQRVVQNMLKLYPRIVGHCVVGADKSHRWLEWLGAKFGEPQGKFLPFEITA